MLIISPNTKKAIQLATACGQDTDFHHYDDADPTTSDIVRLLDEAEVRVVVLGPGLTPERSHELSAEISSRFPFVAKVLYVGDASTEIRAAFRAGATDVVTTTMAPQEVADVVADVRDQMTQRLAQEPAPDHSADPQARVITVLSPRGGVGRTLIAAGLATTLERRFPGEVVIVDLDLQSGDIAPLLGLTPSLSIASMSGRANEIDSADVKATLIQDEEGLHVLAAPAALTAAVGVSPDLVAEVVRLLATSFQYVVVDTGPHLAETTLSAIDQATDVMLVCAPDVPSVRALGRATDALDELKVVTPRRHLIVNKATDRYGMPLRDIEAVSGMSPSGQLPAAKEIAMSLNRGSSFHEALHPRGVIAKALSSIADEIAPATSKTRRGFLRRLR